RVVFLVDEGIERTVQQRDAGMVAHDVARLVGRTRVDDDNLFAPRQRSQTAADVLLLVEADDRRGNRRPSRIRAVQHFHAPDCSPRVVSATRPVGRQASLPSGPPKGPLAKRRWAGGIIPISQSRIKLIWPACA